MSLEKHVKPAKNTTSAQKKLINTIIEMRDWRVCTIMPFRQVSVKMEGLGMYTCKEMREGSKDMSEQDRQNALFVGQLLSNYSSLLHASEMSIIAKTEYTLAQLVSNWLLNSYSLKQWYHPRKANTTSIEKVKSDMHRRQHISMPTGRYNPNLEIEAVRPIFSVYKHALELTILTTSSLVSEETITDFSKIFLRKIDVTNYKQMNTNLTNEAKFKETL